MFFRFQIPGVGNFVVTASSKVAAIRQMQRTLRDEFQVDPVQFLTQLEDAAELTKEQADRQRQGTNDIFLAPQSSSGTTTPGTVDPTTETTTAEPTVTGAGVATGALDPEAVSPFGTFRELLRSSNINPDSVVGGFAQNRFSPLRDTFALAQLLESQGLTPTEGGGPIAEQLRTSQSPASFQDFVRSRGLTGGARDARAGLNLIAGGAAPAAENSFIAALRQATPGSDLGQIIRSVAGEALGTTLSPITRSLFSNSALDLATRRFEDQLARGATTGSSPTFAGVLRRQLGLT